MYAACTIVGASASFPRSLRFHPYPSRTGSWSQGPCGQRGARCSRGTMPWSAAPPRRAQARPRGRPLASPGPPGGTLPMEDRLSSRCTARVPSRPCAARVVKSDKPFFLPRVKTGKNAFSPSSFYRVHPGLHSRHGIRPFAGVQPCPLSSAWPCLCCVCCIFWRMPLKCARPSVFCLRFGGMMVLALCW